MISREFQKESQASPKDATSFVIPKCRWKERIGLQRNRGESCSEFYLFLMCNFSGLEQLSEPSFSFINYYMGWELFRGCRGELGEMLCTKYL